ncbi:MAG: YraN family protein [bacterium]
MSLRKIVGDYGEKLAINYLIRKGYNILDFHFSGRFGEIDIVAVKNMKIHFVEVKSRTNNYFGSPEEGLTWAKIKKLEMTCKHYIYKNKIQTDNYQLDLIAIEIDKLNRKVKIRHYKGIQMNR